MAIDCVSINPQGTKFYGPIVLKEDGHPGFASIMYNPTCMTGMYMTLREGEREERAEREERGEGRGGREAGKVRTAEGQPRGP